LIDGEEDLATLCSSAVVAVLSFIFNAVGTSRRINILVVLLEADLVWDFVIIAIPFLLQSAEVGKARH
jgi:hypothetical protein